MNASSAHLETLSTSSQPKQPTLDWLNMTETAQVDWLILHFNQCFAYENVVLVRGIDEPEYFPADDTQPARIQFAHGFLSSALHEISHWCIAGMQRRLQPDLGYWYTPDGRSAEQQALFEQVEIKPQAVEWLFTRALGKPFRVSLDNLNGNAESIQNQNIFKDNVFAQVQRYLTGKDKLPRDAKIWINYLIQQLRPQQHLHASEFVRADLDKFWHTHQ
ncbi:MULTISPECIES: elongation factor P hydroxylase [unclassified Acinetobacter]|uniref:elongation factor P hydroxylase n=1 Tax=unclassified Acinetobacter TaxID=196816 RepID=UPI0035B7E5A2